MIAVKDQWQRPFGSVRISVTDRCNLRCNYCMPEAEYQWLPRESLLTFEEITRLTAIFAQLGADKIRLTGGEPLLRRNLEQLVTLLHGVAGVREIALTTNALLLAPVAAMLHQAGVTRFTISLDTLRAERMATFARSNRHADVLAGIAAALASGAGRVKLNSVIVRGYNDDEIVTLTDFALARGIEPRFIEYMDVGGATRWSMQQVVSRDEIIAALVARHGAATPVARDDDPHAPAERIRFADGAVVGIIASTTAPFCRDCDRARLTADGSLLLCLYADSGLDLRTPLRAGATDADLAQLVRSAWQQRSDRGAEVRRGVADRGVLVPLTGLRADPRREMHVRGG
ncbi:MAG TPA: GTP 3',8-cyclase MoaA [Gemmatimonadales bacterium]|jgi:cyclic pyranopterin phosphate synthase